MIWERLVLWGVSRGLFAGAIVGALLGVFIALIYGALIGLFVGGIIGAFMGLVDGILVTIITRFAYSPPNMPSHYPKLVYTVAILTNSLPLFLLCAGIDFKWAFNNMALGEALLRGALIGGIPAVIMGTITAYVAGLFLEFTDLMMGYTSSYNPPATHLSHIKN